ncbi:MAG TPA: polysaccharide biosynthesis tyrosine autokinase [Propionibacteriaceae bacterium]|nr:polysaccharide biosynthesis tyrosine autokinase [Propionibacteriaceae bacterium]
MDLHDYLEVLRRRWVSVTIVALATIAVAAAATLAMTTKYTATTRLFFAVQGSKTTTDLAQGSSFAEKQMTSYAEAATSPLVLNPVIERLNLDVTAAQLAEVVTATIPPETVILQVSAVDPDPEVAAAIANAVGDEVVDVVTNTLSPKQNGNEAVKVTPLETALVPTTPSSPNVPRNLALGAMLGVLLGLGVALLRHLLDTRVRSEQDLRAVTDSPLLGLIGYDDKVPNHPLILRDDPMSGAAEAIRRLRTNLQFTDIGDRPRSIVITSSVPGEGKSTTSLNLAVALADAGSRVILIDADLRRPSVAASLGLEGQVGLTTVLIGRAEVEDVVQRWEYSSLDVLPSGRIPPNPSELLGSRAMEQLLERLTTSYDIVLLDTPPLLPVTDAAVLGMLAGGVLVVAGADRVHRPQLRESIEALTTAGVHIHGLVLNRVARQETGAYAYYSGYAPTSTPDAYAAPADPDPVASAEPALPKRAQMEMPTRTVPVASSHPDEVANGFSSTMNGTASPDLRRATPVGQ